MNTLKIIVALGIVCAGPALHASQDSSASSAAQNQTESRHNKKKRKRVSTDVLSSKKTKKNTTNSTTSAATLSLHYYKTDGSILRAKIRTLYGTINDQSRTIKNKDNLIHKLNQQGQADRKLIEKLQQTNHQHEDTIANLKALIAVRELALADIENGHDDTI